MATDFFTDPAMLAPARTVRSELEGGGFVLRSPEPLQPYARCVGEWIEHWAAQTPEATAFAEPAAGGGWTTLTWSQLRARIGAVGQALLDMGLTPAHPPVVLSDNSLDHLVLMLGAMHVGLPACTVSSGYCRLARGDFSRIKGILDALRPGLLFASDAATYGAAIQACGWNVPVVLSREADAVPGARPFASLLDTRETPAVRAAFDAITPDTHAKYLLTSGSTGTPKVAINTHRMLCANQQMMAQTLRFLQTEKPVLLDWLPWSHTFGGNHNMGIVLRGGGTMYIDDGRPMPGLVDKTLAHLRDVSPNLYFNVPGGYDMMLPALEADLDLARSLMGRLLMLFYAGSSMPPATWARLEALAAKVRTSPLWMTTSWGATETAPGITFAHWRLERPGVIGLPMPGVSLKFLPNAGKLEMRVKGDNVFPGYRDNETATRSAFDEDGYYCIGDAGYLVDEQDPSRGVVFNGRVAEDFKLDSGTWVSVGTLRVKAVSALAPYAQDVVITGHDRHEIGMMIFLTEAARALPRAQVASHVGRALHALHAEGGGSSRAPTRALILDDAPNMSAGEITDKGYLNQRMVLTRRAADVEALYAEPRDARVIVD